MTTLCLPASPPLSVTDLAHFRVHGWVRVPAAVEPDRATGIRDGVWDLLATAGMQRNDPASWGKPVDTQRLSREPLFRQLSSPRLVGAIDQLVGAGRWHTPKRWGSFMVTWPETSGQRWELLHHNWHFDCSPGPEMGEALLALYHIDETRAGSGGTLLAGGTHRLLHQYWQDLSLQERSRSAKVHRRGFVNSHPWLQRLHLQESDADKRIAELMDRATVDPRGNVLQVAEATGLPGDVVLCHPFLLHAQNTNRGTMPRLMRIKFVQFQPQFRQGPDATVPLAQTLEPLG